MPEESEKSGKSLVERVRGKGDIELTIEKSGSGLGCAEYYLVAYVGGRVERELLLFDINVPDSGKVNQEPKYEGMLKSLMPDVAPDSITVETFGDLLVHLNARLDALTCAGVNIVKIGKYGSPEEFKAAYAGLPKDQG